MFHLLCLVVLSRGLSAAEPSKVPEPDAKRAYQYLVQICRLGPRPSGSQGMQQQQRILLEHFSKLGGQVRFQSFDGAHPLTGEPVRMNNMLVSWHPRATERVLIACHYDTRPYPDRDLFPASQRNSFIGANDGGSGVALMMELAHHMAALQPAYGIDFVLFDSEEFMFGNRGSYFLGSEHFAREYRDHPPDYKYAQGVVIDMVADRNLGIYMETNSLRYAPEVTRGIWATAARLRIDEFVARRKHEINDDHMPLNQIAKIPTCDIIDFDYPDWHKSSDLPSSCSGESLAKVGTVLLHWLTEVPATSAARK